MLLPQLAVAVSRNNRQDIEQAMMAVQDGEYSIPL
jgi:hypothetical protein